MNGSSVCVCVCEANAMNEREENVYERSEQCFELVAAK